MATHQLGLKSRKDAPETPAGHAMEKMFFTHDDPLDMEQLWLAPTETQQSGFMDDWEEAAAPALSEPSAASEPPASFDLQLGDWIELMVDMRWLRAQLIWVSQAFDDSAHPEAFAENRDGENCQPARRARRRTRWRGAHCLAQQRSVNLKRPARQAVHALFAAVALAWARH